MNCLPSNVKTFIDVLFLAFTLTNFLCGKMVLSFAFKTFLAISGAVSYFFHVVSLTIHAVIFLFISFSRINIFLICVIVNIWFVFFNFLRLDFTFFCSSASVNTLCQGQIRFSQENFSGFSIVYSFFNCNLIISFSVTFFHSQSLEPYFIFNK